MKSNFNYMLFFNNYWLPITDYWLLIIHSSESRIIRIKRFHGFFKSEYASPNRKQLSQFAGGKRPFRPCCGCML